MIKPPLVHALGLCNYLEIYEKMKRFTNTRTQDTQDEIWYLQHPCVYTVGLAKARQFIIDAAGIPVIETDRGGKVTYHGPGQLIVYLLIDLKRLSISVREYVHQIEQAIITLLKEYDIIATQRPSAPGVYIKKKKLRHLGSVFVVATVITAYH